MIKEKDFATFYETSDGELKKICYCIISIEANIYSENGEVDRLLKVQTSTNEYYFTVSGDDLSSLTKFKARFYTYVSVGFSCPQSVFNDLIDYWLDSKPKSIEYIEYAGMNHDKFVSSSSIITKDEIYYQKPSEYNIPVIWKDKENGYLISSKALQSAEQIKPFSEKGVNVDDLVTNLYMNQGGSIVGLIILAYFRACLYATWIHEYYGWFPLLFVAGQKESGKNFLLNKMFRVLGMENPGIGVSIASKTGLNRKLAQVQDYPVWVDEYRNDRESESKLEQLIRSVYNRSVEIKATRSFDGSTFGTQPRGCLIISGESLPSDSATRDRFITVYLRGNEQNRDISLDWSLSELSAIGKGWINTRLNTEKKQFLETLSSRITKIKTRTGASDRVSKSYAVAVLMIELIVSECETFKIDDKMVEQLYNYISVETTDRLEVDNINSFFEDFIDCVVGRRLLPDINYKIEGSTLYLHLSSVYNEIKTSKRRRGEDMSFNSQTIRKYIQEAFEINNDSMNKVKWLNEKSLRVIAIPIDKLPTNVITLIKNEKSAPWA